MIVREIMSSHICTVRPEDPVERVSEIMRTENVGIVPVCDLQDHLAGVITDRDIILRKGFGRTAGEILTPDPVTVSPRQDVHDAALLFSEHGVRRRPVVENGRLTGKLSLRELARKKIYTAELGHILYHISNFEQR